jgi:Ca-activated chloride channel family protein
VSLSFHGTILLLLAFTIRPPERVGDPDSDNREVGIYFKAGHESTADLPPLESTELLAGTEGATEGTGAGPATESGTPTAGPPVPLSLPEVSTPRIGIGGGLPTEVAPRNARDMVRSTGTAPAGGGAGQGGSGGTTFFGQKARGERFVYVLDASGSMYDYNAIGVAKAELLASLAQLVPAQQFQVIFYSEQVYPMIDPGGRAQMFTGTDANRTKASQFVRSIQPLEGTRHREALLEALNYSPDVIFFLTDAGEPRLDASDLDRIRRRNGGKCQIHSIEFGKGAALDIGNNFLKKLSRENGGGYSYRDITQFQKD